MSMNIVIDADHTVDPDIPTMKVKFQELPAAPGTPAVREEATLVDTMLMIEKVNAVLQAKSANTGENTDDLRVIQPNKW